MKITYIYTVDLFLKFVRQLVVALFVFCLGNDEMKKKKKRKEMEA